MSFSYTIAPDSSAFMITDEGDGFDWRARLAAKPELGLHGMGMRMARHLCPRPCLQRKRKLGLLPSPSPEGLGQRGSYHFHGSRRSRVQGSGNRRPARCEASDYLYYIVSGRFLVFSGNKYVSYLTPDDMFIGEMSFLLSNQRSASVVAKGEGRAVKISKQDFVNLIKQNPHYGIFLARLLAQRLTRLNSRAARLNAECIRLKNIVEKKDAQMMPRKTATALKWKPTADGASRFQRPHAPGCG